MPLAAISGMRLSHHRLGREHFGEGRREPEGRNREKRERAGHGMDDLCHGFSPLTDLLEHARRLRDTNAGDRTFWNRCGEATAEDG